MKNAQATVPADFLMLIVPTIVQLVKVVSDYGYL